MRLGFFEARRHEKVLTEYFRCAEQLYASLGILGSDKQRALKEEAETCGGWDKYQEALRQEAAALLKPAYEATDAVGVPRLMKLRSQPDGSTKEFDVCEVVALPYDHVIVLRGSPGFVLSRLRTAMSAATDQKMKALRRLINPLYWLIDIPAFLVRWPFLVLKEAGLPQEIESKLWAQLIKAFATLLWYFVIVALAVDRTRVPELMKTWWSK